MISNLQPVKVGFKLSSLGDIIVYNLILVTEIGKLNLEIYVKQIHGKSLSASTKIFGSGLIWSSAVGGQLSPINGQEPYSMGDGIIPPLNKPKVDLGLGSRFQICKI